MPRPIPLDPPVTRTFAPPKSNSTFAIPFRPPCTFQALSARISSSRPRLLGLLRARLEPLDLLREPRGQPEVDALLRERAVDRDRGLEGGGGRRRLRKH